MSAQGAQNDQAVTCATKHQFSRSLCVDRFTPSASRSRGCPRPCSQDHLTLSLLRGGREALWALAS